MSKNYYPLMLDIIKANWPVNKMTVFNWMCRHRPHSVIEAIKATSDTLSPKFTEPAYVEECRAMLRNNKFIGAIKYWREKTGYGLKEAKEAVEKLRDTMRKTGEIL